MSVKFKDIKIGQLFKNTDWRYGSDRIKVWKKEEDKSVSLSDGLVAYFPKSLICEVVK